MPDGFHARFSAVSREYRYTILNRPVRPALERGRVWHVAASLDAATMAGALAELVGHHDHKHSPGEFGTGCPVDLQNSAIFRGISPGARNGP